MRRAQTKDAPLQASAIKHTIHALIRFHVVT
jgi:hypothetical protein